MIPIVSTSSLLAGFPVILSRQQLLVCSRSWLLAANNPINYHFISSFSLLGVERVHVSVWPSSYSHISVIISFYTVQQTHQPSQRAEAALVSLHLCRLFGQLSLVWFSSPSDSGLSKTSGADIETFNLSNT